MSLRGNTPFLKYRLPLLVWSALMLTVSSIPGNELPQVVSFWEWDKVAHFTVYFIFGVLLCRWMGDRIRPASLPRLLGIAMLFAGLDELHQLFIPNRTCSWYDFLADSLGALAGIVSFHYFWGRPRIYGNHTHR